MKSFKGFKAVAALALVLLFAFSLAGPAFAVGENFTVTYNANNGTGDVPLDPNFYDAGTEATVLAKPENLIRTNYRFVCWNTKTNGSGTDYYPGDPLIVDSFEILYAKWVRVYKVTYNRNGGIGTMTDPNSPYDTGSVVTVLPNNGEIMREFYKFIEWNTELDGSGTPYQANETFTIGANTNLYAQWEKSHYTITYNRNSGAAKSFVEGYLINEGTGNASATLAACSYTVNGFIFDGWNTQADGLGTAYDAGDTLDLAGDTALYAVWAPTFVVKFYSNYGDVADEIRISEPTKVGESITVTLPPFDEFDMHNGKYIGSWNTNRVGTGTSYATGQEVTFTEAEILFAKWVPAYLLTVTADPAAGGTATKVPASRDNFMAGETIELHAEPEPGYYLVNWTDGTSVLGSALDWDLTMPASNYEVTANFEKIPYGVTIVRSAGGKISIDPKKDAYYYGDEITLTAKPNDGYRFVRWIITGESGGKELTALAAADPLTNPVYSCTVFEDMVIDAEYKWVGLITEQPHTVSYHLNGGTGTVPVDMHRYYKGDKVTLASGTGLYRPGAFFMGWATADGTLVKSPYTMGTKDVTFFAVWSAVDYPEIPKTGDEASFLGFAMIALALAAMGYVILRKVHA